MVASPPPEPAIDESDWRFPLWQRVKDALLALPAYFSTETRIEGLRATDIFTLSATLGATIEDQVVVTLNGMRPVWDPDSSFQEYHFVRRPQTFPDVRLVKLTGEGESIAFGIELKGWYLIAKEGVPSFRYKVSPAACTDWDLLVVVPWFLSNVISGKPKVLVPFVHSAQHAAAYRNYWWQHVKQSTDSTEIKSPEDASPYPTKADKISDRPVSDEGGNFGRFARTGLMDAYKTQVNNEPIAGIGADYWRRFLNLFQEQSTDENILKALAKINADELETDDLDDLENAKRIVRQVLESLK